MLGQTRSYTAILPWYEEADFAELLAIGGHGGLSQESYERWYRSVMQTVDDLLREGKTIEFVTIRPAAYSAWLDGEENCLEMRRKYAEQLAAEAA
ncbi:hypothetical protein ACQKLX_01945 [Bosea sp. NPDC003192]|jgi:hypothetical protein|uniref:hypothetical protein n=1 Tax=Bosea sp. NPDC003192 TaxID=3390551 RepID=UPI003D011BA0